jgi:hypothetical protein
MQASRVDRVVSTVVGRLFPDPPTTTTSSAATAAATNPFLAPFPADPTLSQEVALELRGNIVASAPLRTPQTRRACVTALKRMQTIEAYRALRDARAQLAAMQAQLTGDEQLVVEDLLTRIDHALSPYFN